MGETDRYSDYKQPGKKFTLGYEGNSLVALFAINIIFFILLLSIKVIYNYTDTDIFLFRAHVIQYFELPANLSTLVYRPWTILTFMFSDVSVMSILSNMLWLWMFGFIFQELTGNQKLIPLYIYGGLTGALFFIVACYSLPSVKPFVTQAFSFGSYSSVMAIAIGTTFLAPDYRVLKNINRGIPIWVITLLYVIIDLAGASRYPFPVAVIISHIGGGLAGFIFIYLLRRGNDGSIWMNDLYNWFMNLFNPAKPQKNISVKEKIFYNAGNRQPYKKNAIVTQQRVDEILDKISQKGYHFLTDEEKNILKRASEEEL